MFLIRRLLSTISQNVGQNVSQFEHNLMRDALLRKEINEIITKKKAEKDLHNYFRKCDFSNHIQQLKNSLLSKNK